MYVCVNLSIWLHIPVSVPYCKTSTLRQALPSEIGAFGQLGLRALGAEMKVESSLVPCISGILTGLSQPCIFKLGYLGYFVTFEVICDMYSD